MRKLFVALIVILLAALALPALAGPKAVGCTGVCEVLKYQVDAAKQSAQPCADLVTLHAEEATARAALREGRWSDAMTAIGNMQCAAGYGDDQICGRSRDSTIHRPRALTVMTKRSAARTSERC